MTVNHCFRMDEGVRVWEDIVEIPTYLVGEPNKNPMFLEKRVYQGSSGRVYPYPIVDKIMDTKILKPYRIVFLENEYLYIEIIPELGGRVYRALDKTNQYDFVYYNRVIKPALVGLAGPWISGGIEFNWPQHHRPNTFGPVEYGTYANIDGSRTVWVSEIDRMFGSKGMARFTLYPGKAYLEVEGQLFNRTPIPQTFLWWANPAMAANQNTQSIFPPDVTAVFDHGKRDVSQFPIATSTYYKMDYSVGVDISWYKNIPVPTSYMAYQSAYDFLGGYDYEKQAGMLHVANHHISPGKKQWTWGCGDFGMVWDANLTDEDGPYIELMAGVFTDNQPDFSWLYPNEEKVFKQYFLPYKGIGSVKNATIDAAVNFELEHTNPRRATIQVYTTSLFDNAVVKVSRGIELLFSWTVRLSPNHLFKMSFDLPSDIEEHELTVAVFSSDNSLLVSYQSHPPIVEKTPEPAKPLPAPAELKTAESLYLAGLHLEQYRHATYNPEDYYVEGLNQNPTDIRLNNAYGTLLLRQGLFAQSEQHYRRALETSTQHNPNPYDSESYYNLGYVLKLQRKLDLAVSAFYKSVWDVKYQDVGYLALAQISLERGQFKDALDLIDRSIVRNYRSPLARNLRTAVLRRTGRYHEAERLALETIAIDPADFAAHHQLALIYTTLHESDQASKTWAEYDRLMRADAQNALFLVQDYVAGGMYAEAMNVLSRILPEETTEEVNPMVLYSLGYLSECMDHPDDAKQYYAAGSCANSDYCFPNTLWDYIVLSQVITVQPNDARAHYYFGNWLYDKKRAEEAVVHWEASARLDSDFPTVHRNLGLAYANKQKDVSRARSSMERAFQLNQRDARLFFELDQLNKKLGVTPQERLQRFEMHCELVEERDDLYIEYVTLFNCLGQHDKALTLLLSRRFHPWEGGEGKVTGQYVLSLIELGKRKLAVGQYEDAVRMFERALVYPKNLGEGKLLGTQENHICYYLGCAYEGLGKTTEAIDKFERASQGVHELSSVIYYNDQPPETVFYQGLALQRLRRFDAATNKFNQLIDYGQRHLFDEVRLDYFAVSLPNFLLFDDDLVTRNQVHCLYIIALGRLGRGWTKSAREALERVLILDANHQGAAITRRFIDKARG